MPLVGERFILYQFRVLQYTNLQQLLLLIIMMILLLLYRFHVD
jgi:hypothetical protein